VGEIAVPYLDQKADHLKAVALSGGQALETKQGIWMRDGPDFVHIDGTKLDGRLEGITRYQFDDHSGIKKISHAAYGYYRNQHWILYQVQETLFDESIPKVSYAKYDEQKWESVLSPSMLTVVSAKNLEKLSLVGLWKTIQYRQANHLETKVVELIFWSKIMQPFITLIMILLAIPFIFGPLRHASMGLRLLSGLSLGFGFYILTQLFAHSVLSDFLPPVVVVVLPSVVVLSLGLIGIYRIK
jgi:lipopolysaccharide export system permease protein